VTVCHVIAGLRDGGAEAVLFRLCASDTVNRHRVISLTVPGKYGELLQALGVEVQCLHMPRGRVTRSGLLALWKGLRKSRPDVVQTWMYHSDLLGGVVARLSGLPVVWGIRSGHLLDKHGRPTATWLRRCLAAISRWVPDAIICNSRVAADIHTGIGYSSERMRVIPNGVDLDVFHRQPEKRRSLRASWGIPLDAAVVGAVGRYDRYKDYGTLISALKTLAVAHPEMRMVFVGEGMSAENEVLGAALAVAGMRERAVLAGPSRDVAGVMSALDVFALSSAAEGFPSVLIEAMAYGVPAVTTDVGDARSIVGTTGWVVEPRNPDAFSRALDSALLALRDHDSWADRVVACRARVVEHFAIVQMVEAYREVWTSARERRRSYG